MRKLILVAALLPLAACDSGPDVDMKNASVGEVAEEMRRQGNDFFINPGKWQQTVTLVDIDAPGMPAPARDAMRQSMAQTQTHEVCLTEEQAKGPKEEFFSGADQNCRYERFKWGGGKIDMKMVCKQANATQTMAMTGEYQPDTYSMAMDMTLTNQGPSPMGQMTMKTKVDARRVGACDATTPRQG